MKIIGVEKADFIGRDGQEVKGYYVSFTRPIASDKGKGHSVERDYVSQNKEKAWGIDIPSSVGKEADVFYTRKGKVASITIKN